MSEALVHIEQNALALQADMSWLAQVIEHRFKTYFGEAADLPVTELPPPPLPADAIYADVVRHFQMGTQERLVLLLALAPHVCPQLLDMFFTKNETYGRGFSEFGGIKGHQHSGFLPTGETAAF
ncbi:MAG: ATP-binding protein, partial [Bacteroidetes bacterium]